MQAKDSRGETRVTYSFAKGEATLSFDVVYQTLDHSIEGLLVERQTLSAWVEGDFPMTKKTHIADALEARNYVEAGRIVNEYVESYFAKVLR